MKPIVWVILTIILTSNSLAQEPLPGLRYWERQGEIAQSPQKKDYRVALGLLREADIAVPSTPDVIFRMAIAEAFLHEERASLLHLKRLAEMHVYFDLAKEPAFVGLTKLDEFRKITRSMEKIKAASFYRAGLAFRIPEQAFLPEGLAYDSQSKDFFVASIYKRKIVRVDSKGGVSDFITSHQDEIWGVGGIGLDSTRRTLWACSAAFDANEGYTAADRNKTALYAYDVDTGKLSGKYSLEKPGNNHFCDGVAVASDGTVFVADSMGLIIYRLDLGASDLQTVVSPQAGISPQGLALSRDENTLFVSNYLSGIYLVDLKSKKISNVHSKAKQSLAGIDGLMSYGNELIAIQNGIQPNRVVRLTMSRDGRTVNSIQLLEVNHPLFGEPTLGVVKGDTLFFVANNPVSQFLRDRQLTALAAPVILKRDLR